MTPFALTITILTSSVAAVLLGWLGLWVRECTKRRALYDALRSEIDHIKPKLTEYWRTEVMFHPAVQGGFDEVEFLRRRRFITVPPPQGDRRVWNSQPRDLLSALGEAALSDVRGFYGKFDDLQAKREQLVTGFPQSLAEEYDYYLEKARASTPPGVTVSPSIPPKLASAFHQYVDTTLNLWGACSALINELATANPLPPRIPWRMRAAGSPILQPFRTITTQQFLVVNSLLTSAVVGLLAMMSGHVWMYVLGVIVVLTGVLPSLSLLRRRTRQTRMQRDRA